MNDKERAKDKIKEALSTYVPKETKEKLQKKALSKLSIDENNKAKVGAALGVAKALAEKKFKLKINKNLDMDLKLDKDEKRVGFSYKIGF